MRARTRVYAVTSGEYSDYRVEAVFETEDDANDAMRRGMGDDVIEMDYFAPGVKPSHAKWVNLVVLVNATTGDLDRNRHGRPETIEHVFGYSHKVWRHPNGPRLEKTVEKAGGRSAPWRVAVQGPDTERTRKVFYDLVAKTRAEIVEGFR